MNEVKSEERSPRTTRCFHEIAGAGRLGLSPGACHRPATRVVFYSSGPLGRARAWNKCLFHAAVSNLYTPVSMVKLPAELVK